MDGIEYHPLLPFLPENGKVLFLGSFPPQRKRWCMDFFYPNFINDHWRIEGEVFFGDRLHFVRTDAKAFDLERIVDFCREKGIAFYDTATAVRRLKDNASDKYLEVVEPTDVRALLRQLPQCVVIVTTGEKATGTLCEYFNIKESRSHAAQRIFIDIPDGKLYTETDRIVEISTKEYAGWTLSKRARNLIW